MPRAQPADQAVTPATVTTEVAASLYEHLQAQGRQRGNVQDLAMLLARATEREWGTAKARRFNDDQGGGWLVELAGYLDGEELYAMVRSSHGGSRLMTAVVDVHEVEAFNAGKGWQSSAARGNGVDPEIEAEAEAIAAGQKPPTQPYVPALREAPGPKGPVNKPDDPMLVVVTLGDGGQKVIRGTREEVPGVVKMLLSQGLGGNEVAEDDIEVWSSVSKPKVEVRF